VYLYRREFEPPGQHMFRLRVTRKEVDARVDSKNLFIVKYQK
jgi:hypothetical protein